MPRYGFLPQTLTSGSTTVYGQSVPNGIADAGTNTAWVRRYAGNSAQTDREGTLFSHAIFTTENIPMGALTEVFGLEAHATWPDGSNAAGQVEVQVTLDDGVTYLAWDGAAWAEVATDGVYNSLAELNEFCGQLDLVRPLVLGFRIKLSTANNLTPTLRRFAAFVEWVYDSYDDVVQTLDAHFNAHLRIRNRIVVNLEADSAEVPVDEAYPPSVTTPDFLAFNLTADPYRNVNLFESYADEVVTLSAAQDSGSHIEISYRAATPVTVIRMDENYFISELPYTVIRVEVVTDDPGQMTGTLCDYKRGTETLLGRTRQHPNLARISLMLEHWSARPDVALKAIQEFRRVLGIRLKSRATGEVMAVVESQPGRSSNAGSESFHMGSWSGALRLYFHGQHYTQAPLLKDLVLDAGSMSETWLSDEAKLT